MNIHKLMSTLILVFSLNSIYASDIDLLDNHQKNDANILFVMDLSGSMNYRIGGINGIKRIDVLRPALAQLIRQATPDLHLGLLPFGRQFKTPSLEGIEFPISDIATNARTLLGHTRGTDRLTLDPTPNETTQSYLARIVEEWEPAEGFRGTPTSDTIYEAALYFRGEEADWGHQSRGPLVAAHPLTVNRPNNRYISPITNQCQKNYIVLLSDGAPTTDLLSTGALATQYKRAGCRASTFSPYHGICAYEILQDLANKDIMPSIPGKQIVETFSIGLGGLSIREQGYLKSLVTIKDDPSTSEREGYFIAKNRDDLVAAFDSIFTNISSGNTTFSNASYSLDTMNRGLSHDGYTYISFPSISKRSAWKGNLKKFKIATKIGPNNTSNRVIVGKNNELAFDEVGALTAASYDFWSTSTIPDGQKVLSGGVASVLTSKPSSSRHLLTNIQTGRLLSANNLLASSNTKLTADLLGHGISASERSELLDYIADTEKGIGDILHFTPITITYSGNKRVLITGTNEGFLHAFDDDTGNEIFAFMPKELLPNIKKIKANALLSKHVDKLYGIDGRATLSHDDKNYNGIVDDTESAYLYFGLRRGGTGYYALDISDISNPKILWSYNANGSDHHHLGQSWSKPYLTKVFDKNGDRLKVVVLAGGYDPILDRKHSLRYNSPTHVGNDIIILNAETGEKLWSLQHDVSKGHRQLKHSIPGGIRLIDMNKNGAIDRMYFADTGGNVWRVDLNEALGQSDLYTTPSQLTHFASLSGFGAHARQFYNEPEVSLLQHKSTTTLAVAIGSGHRPYPKDTTIQDQFFLLLDPHVFTPPPSTASLASPNTTPAYKTITFGELAVLTVDTQDNKTSLNTGSLAGTNLIDAGLRGWRLELEKGEKSLSDAVTNRGTILFTSYIANAGTSNSTQATCNTVISSAGRLYALDLLTGKAAGQFSTNGVVDNDAIYRVVSTSAIPSKPQRVYNNLICVDGKCTHTVDIRVGTMSIPALSYDISALQPIYWIAP